MIGIMLNKREAKEMVYLLKKELEELLSDLKDDQIEPMVKTVLEERYHLLFRLFTLLASPAECTRFCRRKQEYQ
ncbi:MULTISPECIES: hypothetical protein [Fictibacillus]|jgi:hypothetical protein|uniref:Uncharacterized protein n=1 Tax=Fictibacillus enclensis TaxID=1017270 RepID=A0A0V8IUT0_9BACL|nr:MULTISPECIES: hypothetical protein [Fictibacillus]KSU78487.1 hypothetical protein AS030_21925 [Fictibacillus enclensis]RXZ00936.1 hypothetical protein DMO16_15490 [Fictibacillus sp. S7]SCC41039.1 hypothetical protein GA0061096_4600 [Fictibacillus enclensis]